MLLGVRDEGKGREAAHKLAEQGYDVQPVVIDVSDRASIHNAAEQIIQEFGRLDLLINNAGVLYMDEGPPSMVDETKLRHLFEINFFGAIAVTQAFVPLLKLSEKGHIVNVSSGLGSLTQQADPEYEYAGFKLLGYVASKAALNAFTIVLAAELMSSGIRVNSADPGYTATALNNYTGQQSIGEGAEAIARLALQKTGPTAGFFAATSEVPW